MQEFKDEGQVLVMEIPPCDICQKPAAYDAKTKAGPWAYLCGACFDVHGIGTGLGKGQRLILREVDA